MSTDRGARRGRSVVGLLDIGSSKIVCLIVALDRRPGSDGPAARVVGLGHQRSRGVKAGVITDMDEAERAIRSCVSQAERMAGVQLEAVHVSVACGRMRSLNFAANAEIKSGVVSEDDIAKLLAAGRAYAERDGRTLVHMNRVGFRLDGSPGGRDPRGMAARRLTADLHAVSVDDAPLRNLAALVERCYLGLDGIVAAPYASALATTTAEERRLGVTSIDFGGGTTKIAMFADGQLLNADVIPVGSDHITFDIARGLQTPLAEAERIKALYGTLVGARSDEHEVFSYPLAGEEDGSFYQTTKAELTRIITRRVETILALAAERLERSGLSRYAGERIVLSGGGSELIGMAERAANVLGQPARVARPIEISGLPQAVAGPAFATVAGILFAGLAAGQDVVAYREEDGSAPGYLGRVGQWLTQGL